MLIYVFPPHYQLVYINFDISSFSLISYQYTFRASQKYILCSTKVHFVVVSIFNAYST